MNLILKTSICLTTDDLIMSDRVQHRRRKPGVERMKKKRYVRLDDVMMIYHPSRRSTARSTCNRPP